MKIKKIQHSLITDSTISYGFFTRIGGKSVSPYDSLNCGFNSGDDKLNVIKNIEIDPEHCWNRKYCECVFRK